MNGQESAPVRRKGGRLVVIAVIAVIILLFVFFLKDIMIPLIRLEMRHDLHGVRELLADKGLFGALSVILVEALQMVVVFIPAEFIQISTGLSYPLWIAILLCDLGVCLGATIIFSLVRWFKVRNIAFEKRRGAIERLSKTMRDRNTVLLLYLLFFMPFIPFGAICYYGSSTRLKYGKYILTVATGVIPSIVTSNLMGAAGKAFIKNSIPIPLLILIIVLLAAVLFAVIFVFLDRIYFKENEGTPDSVVYSAVKSVLNFLRKNKQKLTVDASLLKDAEVPYFMLVNHESFYDFYYVAMLDPDLRVNMVANEYYITRPVLKTLAGKIGVIPKKLFTKDLHTIGGILGNLKRGYPVVIFPEGRLSPDGRMNRIAEKSAGFYKRLGKDIVFVKISGAYLSKPKWRRRFYKSDINVSVTRVIKKDELSRYSEQELNRIIEDELYYEDSGSENTLYKQKDKAKGLENLIYRCPDCGALYTTYSNGCSFGCTSCGKIRTLNERYVFDDGSRISDLYGKITEDERKEAENVKISTNVRTKVFVKGKVKRRGKGFCSFDKNEFRFTSDDEEFTIKTENIPALAFSCNDEFELYHGEELYYFYPCENKRQTARWALLADIFAEARDE